MRLSTCAHLRLLTLGGDGVDLVNEDDGGRVLLRLLERLPQVALRLAGQLRHDLWAVDEEEEGAWQTADLNVGCGNMMTEGQAAAKTSQQDAITQATQQNVDETEWLRVVLGVSWTWLAAHLSRWQQPEQ